MSGPKAAFAIPGDINTVTGGYIYERRLLEGLRDLGHDVAHIQFGDSFPDPSDADMKHAARALHALDPSRALILDGLVFGSIDTDALARVTAPIVAMVHHPLALETGLSEERATHLFRVERANLARTAHVLVPSPHTAAILTGQYDVPQRKITIAPPGTDRPLLQNAPSQPPLILSVGILHPRKGHDVLLRALSELRDMNWRAVIVGGPHDRDHAADLARMVRELNLQDRVHLAGRIPQDALDDLFAKASIFALATRYEGYGMVFDEALGWGLPIISCATGAVPDTVPGDAGLLVAPDAPLDLSRALRKVLGDDAMRNKMASAALKAGQARPPWVETARIASGVLARVTKAAP
ncbi:glycosyltransferase family 4 protein [Hasllibacter sp. MH4015]|uniref:glycosyltransferase family 4 protein n=1 Tax=Hasllibacter sp. MH4015 TaxID=2854029 RepID=UPI001CD6357E|nr:glycosyltransferase family 4 protein [Hasllibacter sp. MH4015]